MLIVLALLGGVGYGGYSYLASVKAPVTNQASAKGKSSKSKASPDHHAAAHKPDAADPASTIGTFTGESAGAPIDLLMMPNGAYAIIHLRPAELWAADSTGLEVVACLGPLGVWLKDKISTACLQDVAQIESATFGLIPSVKGQPPEVAVIVRTTNEIKRSELLDKFNGEQKDDLGRPYIQGETSAYLILDSRTYAVVPAALASEMVAAADNPPALQDSLQDLLFKSDRKQPVTIAFLPNAVRDDMFVLVPAPVQKLLNSVLDWLGDETEAAMWTVRVAPKFDSQLLVRNSTVISARKLAEGLQKKLAATPHELLSLVEQTHPRTVGSRKLVGRFPAMTQAFAKSTKIAHGPRLVAFNTELPERAGPNLAAAGLFTWDLTNQPDFGSGPKTAPQVAAEVALPAKLSDRLKKSISVDFRDEFLYSAIDFIGEETTVKFKLEGNDLKADGTTQNERQNLKMEGTAFAVLNTILSKKNLVMIIDEEKKLVTVTTAKAAAAKNLPVYPIEKELEKK